MNVPSIITGRNDVAHSWKVGDYFLTAYPAPQGWGVRVRSRGWGDTAFVLDGHFGSEADAITWCRRIATVFTQDHADG